MLGVTVPSAGAQADSTEREVVVEFDSGRIPSDVIERLERIGASVLGYEPGGGVIVRADSASLSELASVPGFAGVEPGPVVEVATSPGALPNLYTVTLDPDAVEAELAAIPGVEVVDGSDRIVLVATSDPERVARAPRVQAVQGYVPPVSYGEFAGGVIMGSAIAAASGYDGAGQVIGVADGGFGTGVAATAHRDVPGSRIVALRNWPAADGPGCWTAVDDGPADVDTGHGTHVAGAAVSDGGPGGEGRGTAPGASLVFQAIEDYIDFTPACEAVYADGYYLLGLPVDIGLVLAEAYDDGARIHNDSWGFEAAGAYTADSLAADAFVWDNPDMTIVVAAGNNGTDADADGVIDPGSIGSPASAKNVIAVGASEGDRSSGYPCDASGSGLPFDLCTGFNDTGDYADLGFGAAPLASDPMVGNAGQMAAFSSRGPAHDGRIKPDVVAPGTWILSTYSDMYQQGYDGTPNPQTGAFQALGWGLPFDRHYKYNSGTSMASPLVAGAAAVVRQYVEDVSGDEASAALVKALLINAAVDMADENNDGSDDNDLPIPNVHEGWGRVDLASVVDHQRSWVDGHALTTGEVATFAVDTDGSEPLRITTVWSDHPATVGASSDLVNDLDLVVRAPDGSTYRGNRFSGGWSLPGGSADRINNTENVYVADPGAGRWTIEVRGHNVPFGPQPFALVIDGDIPHPAVSIRSPSPDARVAGVVTVSGTSADAVDVAVSVDGVPLGRQAASSGTWSFEWNTTGLAERAHTIVATATNAAGTEAVRSRTVSVDNLAPGGSFVDDDGNVHEPMIEAIAASGITQGCSLAGAPVRRYCPDDAVTRGQMAAFLVRAFGLDGAPGDSFEDDDWSIFEGDIEALAAAGVTLGCNPPENDRFCPEEPVTRAQMAAFLVRAADLAPAGGNPFSDDDGSVFEDDIAALAAAGITVGCNPPAGDRYCPEQTVRRDQMASFLGRALGLKPLVP